MTTTMRKHLIPTIFAGGLGLAALLAQEKEVDPFDPSQGAEKSIQVPPSDPTWGTPKLIEVRVEFVEMSHEKLTELVFLEEPGSSDATALRRTVAELVKGGEASILETMMVVARSGQKATSESIREFIYPTEYEPPEVPMPKNKGNLTPDDLKALWMMATPATPTAFETKNLGSRLEVDVTISPDDGLIDLRVIPEIIWHTGNDVWVERKDGLGNVSKIEMPGFYKVSVNTAITCVPGQYNLVAALSPKDQNGVTDMTRKVMVFVKCDVEAVQK
jgi:hypothetical protein